MKEPTENGALAFFAASPDSPFDYDKIQACAFAQYLAHCGAAFYSVGGFNADWRDESGYYHSLEFSDRFRAALRYGPDPKDDEAPRTFGGIVAAYKGA